jgi:hypothetical protein
MDHLRIYRLVPLLLPALAGLLVSCSEVVPSTGPHLTTPPAAVHLYQNPPPRYELLGPLALPLTPEMKWDENGDADLAFDSLKAKASAMGANGVLLKLKKDRYDISVGAGYHGKNYLVPMKSQPRTLVVDAIYVTPK